MTAEKPVSLCAFCAFFWLTSSEVSLARVVATVTVELDRVARTLTRRAAVLVALLRRTRTRRICANVVVVSHESSPFELLNWNKFSR